MNSYHRFLIGFTVAAAMLGCVQKNVVPPPADDLANKPSMPPLGALSKSSGQVPVLGHHRNTPGSPLDELGRQGIFSVHRPKLSQIALLKNGDESFAMRVQLL